MVSIPIKASYKHSKVGYWGPSVLLSDETPLFLVNNYFFSSNTRKRRRKNLTRKSKMERKQEFRDLMDQFGWTQAELSRPLGVSSAWVTKVINNPKQIL